MYEGQHHPREAAGAATGAAAGAAAGAATGAAGARCGNVSIGQLIMQGLQDNDSSSCNRGSRSGRR